MLKIVVENDNKLVIDGSKRAYLILLRNRRINIEYQILESCKP